MNDRKNKIAPSFVLLAGLYLFASQSCHRQQSALGQIAPGACHSLYASFSPGSDDTHNPSRAGELTQLGLDHLAQDRSEDAAKYFAESYRCAPGPDALLGGAQALLKLGCDRQAQGLYVTVLRSTSLGHLPRSTVQTAANAIGAPLAYHDGTRICVLVAALPFNLVADILLEPNVPVQRNARFIRGSCGDEIYAGTTVDLSTVARMAANLALRDESLRVSVNGTDQAVLALNGLPAFRGLKSAILARQAEDREHEEQRRTARFAEESRQREAAQRRQAVIDESCRVGVGALDATTLSKFALSGIRLGMSRTDFDAIFSGGVDEACNEPFQKSECAVVLPSNWDRAAGIGRLVCDPDAIDQERQQCERNPRLAKRVGYPIEVKFWQGKLFYASLLVPRTAATEQFGRDALQAMPKRSRKILYKDSGYEGWASGGSEFGFVAIAAGVLGKSFADIDAGTPGKSRAGYRITLEDTAISKIYDREYEKRTKATSTATSTSTSTSTSVRVPISSSKPPESRLRDFVCKIKCTFGGVMVPSQVRMTTATVKATSASDASGQIGLKMSQVCGSSPNGGALSIAFSGVQKCE